MKQSIPSRSKLRSLEGVKVCLHTVDGVPHVGEGLFVVFEEVSEFGLLFRDKHGYLIFASTASFTLAEKSD